MSGDYRSKKEVSYLLVPAVGRKVIDLGGDLQKGMYRYVCHDQILSLPSPALTFKLLGNSLILGNLEVLAEAFTFAQKSGIAEENVNTLINGSFQCHFDIPADYADLHPRVFPSTKVLLNLRMKTRFDMRSQSIVSYAHKMMTNDFDGKEGFSIDGGIKDATFVKSRS